MKKFKGIMVMAALFLATAGVAASGWSAAIEQGHEGQAAVDVAAVKKFQKETLSLRDELYTKQLELRNEYIRPEPDTAKIAGIRKDIIDIETKIQDAAKANGVADLAPGCGTGCGQGFGMMANCRMQGEQGRFGHGRMMDQGQGRHSCPQHN